MQINIQEDNILSILNCATTTNYYYFYGHNLLTSTVTAWSDDGNTQNNNKGNKEIKILSHADNLLIVYVVGKTK